MDAAHEKLAWQAAQTGYGQALIEAITEAATPRYQRGAPLSDEQAQLACEAIDTLAQAGYQPELLSLALEHYRQAWGEQWRERFWWLVVRRAARRFNEPAFYGVSPLETDEVRIARWGPAPVWGQASDPAPPEAMAA